PDRSIGGTLNPCASVRNVDLGGHPAEPQSSVPGFTLYGRVPSFISFCSQIGLNESCSASIWRRHGLVYVNQRCSTLSYKRDAVRPSRPNDSRGQTNSLVLSSLVPFRCCHLWLYTVLDVVPFGCIVFPRFVCFPRPPFG